MAASSAVAPAAIELPALSSLFSLLDRRGYRVIGPTVRDGAVVYDFVDKVEDLPAGWTDEQDAGRYRLVRNGSPALFGYTISAQGWRRYLLPPEVLVFEGARNNGAFRILPPTPITDRYALLGVRPCELAAIAVQDRVLMADRYLERGYSIRRTGALIIAVNCTHASRTCFCSSMGTGPRAAAGFDLCLTELADAGRHVYLVQSGSDAGDELLAALDHRAPAADELAAAEAAIEDARRQVRSVDTHGLQPLVYESFDHPRWEKTAARCFACGNCTLVCPTCFCNTVEESTDVACEHAERWRKWDSCFTEPFSYIHGGSVRSSVKSRYRQRLTHKMASWIDQFGTFGCVGCGRCITWCPGKIDITEEVAALRGVEGRSGN